MSGIRERGFTLVEIMIAVFVFSVLAATAYATLNGTVQAVEVVNAKMTRLQALQRTVLTLENDFIQLSPRPVREELATAPSPALVARAGSDYLAEFTRGGHSNPLFLPRPSLQRVAYVLDEDVLVRLQWPVLDRPQGTEVQEVALLDGVTAVEFRYLPANGEWQDEWPGRGASGAAALRLRPRAVEITMLLEDYGEIRRLIEVTG